MSRIGGAAPAAALTEPSIECRWRLVARSTFWPFPHGPSPESSPHNSATKHYSLLEAPVRQASGARVARAIQLVLTDHVPPLQVGEDQDDGKKRDLAESVEDLLHGGRHVLASSCSVHRWRE